MRTIIAVLHKNGGDSAEAVVKTLESLKLNDICAILATPSAIFETDDLDKLQHKDVKSSVVIGCAFSKSHTHERPQSVRIENATLIFNGRFYPPTYRNPLTTKFAQRLQIGYESAMEKQLWENEGDFSLTVAELDGIMAARDPIGVEPFYYGENADFAALASNRTALWKTGLAETYSFPPGNLAKVNKRGFEFKPVKTLVPSKPKRMTMEQAAQALAIAQQRNSPPPSGALFGDGLSSSELGQFRQHGVELDPRDCEIALAFHKHGVEVPVIRGVDDRHGRVDRVALFRRQPAGGRGPLQGEHELGFTREFLDDDARDVLLLPPGPGGNLGPPAARAPDGAQGRPVVHPVRQALD